MTQGLERLLASGGVAFVAMLLIAVIVDDAETDAYVLGLAAFFLVAFLGALRGALRRVEGETAPLSATAVIGGSAAAIVYLLLATAYMSVADLSESTVEVHEFAAVEVHEFAFAASFPQAAVLGAAGSVMFRTGAVSRALGLAGQALLPLQLAAPLILLSTSERYAIALALAPFCAWVAAVSILLLGRPAGAAATSQRGS